MDEEDLVVVSEKSEKEDYKEKISAHVTSLLLTGFFIGAIACISVCGLIQTMAFTNTGPLYEFAIHLWLRIEWWYWIIPLVIAVLAFFWVHSSRIKKIVGERSDFKN